MTPVFARLALFAVLICQTSCAPHAISSELTPRDDNNSDAGLQRYIVTVEDHVPANHLVSTHPLLKELGDRMVHIYDHVMNGFAADFSELTAEAVRAIPAVQSVDKTETLTHQDTQSNAPYNLAITSEWGTLQPQQQNEYQYVPYYGPDVQTVYVLDSGVNVNHLEFRQFNDQSRAYLARNFVKNTDANDYDGHGTHVAGIIGAATYGVMKRVFIASVKVCFQNKCDTGDIIKGIDFVIDNSQHGALQSVINLSLGGRRTSDTKLGDAVRKAYNNGITVVVAAGNGDDATHIGYDACNFTPAYEPSAITVAAIDSSYTRASFSNWGSCVDFFAPGVGIESTYIPGETDTQVLDGTSMAAPHISGLIAYYMALTGYRDPETMRYHIQNYAELGYVQDAQGSPNAIGNNGYKKGAGTTR